MSAGNWAEISPDELYRYALHRAWADGPVLGWLMLNPSTADAVTDDQTIRKITHISKREGYGSAWVANLFAYRMSSPDILRDLASFDPAQAIGPANDMWLQTMLAVVPEVVLAWGAHGRQPWAVKRRDEVLAVVGGSGVTVACLGRTADGEPKHPCRLANATPLEAWAP